jgi:hypothetical protein
MLWARRAAVTVATHVRNSHRLDMQAAARRCEGEVQSQFQKNRINRQRGTAVAPPRKSWKPKPLSAPCRALLFRGVSFITVGGACNATVTGHCELHATVRTTRKATRNSPKWLGTSVCVCVSLGHDVKRNERTTKGGETMKLHIEKKSAMIQCWRPAAAKRAGGATATKCAG